MRKAHLSSFLSKKYIASILLLLAFAAHGQQNKKATFLKRDSIFSSLDNNKQVFYYYKATAKEDMPLVVQLHSWSYNADSLKTLGLDSIAAEKNYNYIFPDFRGINNHSKACCSEFVISDIDEAIDWALRNLNVDKSKIYVIGSSGGGLATLAMYMKSRHKIHSFSAWAATSDLIKWYQESLDRKKRFAGDILKCIDSPYLDTAKVQARSPYYMLTPVKKRRNSALYIHAGIHDGHKDLSVPISHSIRFYNKLLKENKVNDSTKYVNEQDANTMLATQKFPPNEQLQKLGEKDMYYRNAKNISLSIFDGGHDMVSKVVLGEIESKK